MITGIVIAFAIWCIILATILIPKSSVVGLADRITNGSLTDDRVPLQIMLDHLRSYPEEWSINRDAASFPLKGAKQIFLNRDQDGWTYALSSFDTRETRRLSGYYEAEFKKLLLEENAARESKALLTTFYPELNGTLLLSNKP